MESGRSSTPAKEQPGGGFRAPLRFRSFRYLISAYAISATGDWLYNTVLLVFVYERTRSASWVAAASIVRITPEILFGPVAGAIADRYGRKRVMIACDAARALLMFALTAVVLLDQAPIVIALGIVFLATVAGTPSFPAVAAITPSLVDEDALAPANSLVSVVDYTALALGPALGGVLVLFSSATLVFAINGASFVLSAVLLFRVAEQAGVVESATTSLKENVREGFKAVRASPEATTLLALILPMSFVFGVSFVTFVLVSDGFLEKGPDGATFLFAAVGVGGMVGSGLVGRANRSARPGSIVGVTTALVGLSFGSLAVVRSAPLAYLLMGVLGAAIILGEVVSTTVLQRLLSEEVLGRIFGIQGTIIYSAILVGSLVAPVLVTSFGLGPSLVIAGAASMVTVPATTTRLLAVDRATPAYLDDIASPMSLLQSLPIFDGAPAASLEAMARSCSKERVPKGQIIIREGDPAMDFFVVVSGALNVLSSGEEGGQKKVVNRLAEGDYFGEIGLLERLPRTATVKAETDTVLYRIKGHAFLDAVTQAPVISGVLLGGVMRGLARTHPSYRPTTPPTTASTGAQGKGRSPR